MIEWLVGQQAAGEFNFWELVFLHQPNRIELVILGLIVAVLIPLFILNLKRLPSRRWRLVLLGLRLLFLAGLLLLWLQPAVQLQKRLQQKSHVILMNDRSRSMSLLAGDGDRTRAAMANEFFSENTSWVKSIAASHHLHAFSFEQKPSSIPLSKLTDKGEPSGDYSDFGAALSVSTDQFRKGEVAAVVLVSDGVSNPSPGTEQLLEDVLATLKKAKVPVYAFGAGTEGAVKDMAVRDVRYDGFAFVHNKTTIEVDIASTGYPERPVQVTLEADGRPIGSQNLVVPSGEVVKAAFSFTPERVGRAVYTVKLPLFTDDAIPQNNTRSFIIEVIRDKVRVLHVCGHPDYDEQFLRRFLKNNPNVDLISFFILRTNADLQLVPERELSLIPFPTQELFDTQLHTFDLVIFQNFTYQGYEMSHYLPNIRRYVLEGGALLVLGGDVSYGPGGYDNTPIEDVLPFDISLQDPAASSAPFAMQVTPEGLRHPIMRLRQGMEANRAAWQQAPELLGLNLGLMALPDALVLAEHPTLQTGGKPAPAIALRRPGKGRVLATALDSTWLWYQSEIEQGGDGELYTRFWSNALRWLIKDPDLKHLAVRADKDNPSPGQEVQLDIRLTDDDFQPKADARLRVRAIEKASGKPLFDRELATDSEGTVITRFAAPEVEGVMTVQVETVDPAAGEIEREELLLYVSSNSGEFRDVAVDFDRLRKIAKETGGEFKSLPYKMPADFQFPVNTVARIGKKRDVPIWDNSTVLGLLVFLIALEWWLRKRKRLN